MNEPNLGGSRLPCRGQEAPQCALGWSIIVAANSCQRRPFSGGRIGPHGAVPRLGMAWFAAVVRRSDIAKHGHSTGLAAIGRLGRGWHTVAGRPEPRYTRRAGSDTTFA